MLRWQIERLYMAEQLRRYKVSLLYETLPTTKTTYYCLGTLPVNILMETKRPPFGLDTFGFNRTDFLTEQNLSFG